MNNLMESYEKSYGLAEKTFLRVLGGDPDRLVAEIVMQAAELNPLLTMLGQQGALTADDVHNAIIHEIKRIYFSGVPREAAVAIANSIPQLGAISLCTTIPDLSFNVAEYAYAWTSANPEQQPIKYSGYDYT